MWIVYEVVIFLIFVINYIRKKSLLNCGSVFSLYWFVLMLFANFRLFGLFEISDEINRLVFLGVLFFEVGVIVTDRIKIKSGKYIFYAHNTEIYFLFLLAFIILFITSYRSCVFMIHGASLSDIRYSLQKEILNNYIITMLYRFVALPVTVCLIFTGFSKCIVDIKSALPVLTMAAVLSVMAIITEGGRRQIYCWFICGTVLLYENKSKIIKLSKHIRKYITCAVILTIISILIIFAIRKAHSPIESCYMYFAGPFVLFSKRIVDIKKTSYYTYGVASFSGLMRPIMGILEKTGFKWELFNEADRFLLWLNDTASVISTSGKYYNYFTTCFSWFYKDGGILGICIISMIYGMIANIIFRKCFVILNEKYFGLMLFIMYSIMFSMMSFSFAELDFAEGLILFMIIFRNKKRYQCMKFV